MLHKQNQTIDSQPSGMTRCAELLPHFHEKKMQAWRETGESIRPEGLIEFVFAESPTPVRVPLPESLDLVPIFEDVVIKKGMPRLAALAADVLCKEGTRQELERPSVWWVGEGGSKGSRKKAWNAIYTHCIEMHTGDHFLVLWPYRYDHRGQPSFRSPRPWCIAAEKAPHNGPILALLAECRKHVLSLGG